MKNNVSLQVPVSLSEFSAMDDGRTIAKLKMFYVGETADGRVFTKEFADKLVESLPYCPVVGYYSDIKADFNGHNSKQFIYGFVRPDADYGFEKDDDGKEWLVTEVMLYTDRPDNTGEVAKKIVGQPHSLELNPNNVKYEVFSEGGKRKIKFTEGSLIGLSVLGTDQKPAFTGSEFFMASDFSDMRERFDNFFSFLENGRGGQMENKEQFESYVEFVKLSYTDKMRKANDVLQEQLGDNFICYVEDMDDTSFIAASLDFNEGVWKHFKYDYTMDDVEFSISNEREVFLKYLTLEEINKIDSFLAADDKKEDEKEDPEDKKEEEMAEQEDDKKEDKKDEEEDEDEKNKPAFEESVEPAVVDCAEDDKKDEEDEEPAKEDEEGDKPAKKEEEVAKAQEIDMKDEEDKKEDEDESSKEEDDDKEFSEHTSTLSDSERSELENYRKQAKVSMINSYEGMLEKSVLDTFTNKIEEYDLDKLEAALAIEFSKYSRENKNGAREIPLSFGRLTTGSDGSDTSYKGLVEKILHK